MPPLQPDTANRCEDDIQTPGASGSNHGTHLDRSLASIEEFIVDDVQNEDDQHLNFIFPTNQQSMLVQE